jgi:hypothetical protein
LFSEQICEVQGEGVRYVLRKNEKKAARERHRLEDKLEKLTEKIAARNKSRNVKKLTGKARLTLGGRSCIESRKGTDSSRENRDEPVAVSVFLFVGCPGS